jgi:hypothetical protein
VHVLVGELGEQRAVRLQRIAQLELRRVSLPPDAADRSVCLPKGDNEVVVAEDLPFDLLA